MKKNKNKKNIIIILIGIVLIGILILGIGVYLGNQNKKIEEEDKPIRGVNEGMTYDEFYNWETKLNVRAIELVEEVFNDKYPIEKDGTFTITLYDLQTKYGKNLSQYNTNTITCDLKNSIITIKKENEEYRKSVRLVCSNSEEQ